jgi:REP element-mobilizing transposase RayT
MLFYRRKLPHWVPDDSVISMTWRLAGSAPPSRPEILTAENTGRALSGPLWLRDARVARIVEDAIQFGETARGLYALYAWVIMPNHVHLVIEPKAALPGVMRWLKGRTGRVANSILGRTGMAFWQDESYDHWIRSSNELRETIAYVESNPVKAGLVDSEELWP